MHVNSFAVTTHPHSSTHTCWQVGIANYAELAKGQMLGGMDGFLKIIFSTEDFRILGVHAIGEGATEIVHIGQVRARPRRVLSVGCVVAPGCVDCRRGLVDGFDDFLSEPNPYHTNE